MKLGRIGEEEEGLEFWDWNFNSFPFILTRHKHTLSLKSSHSQRQAMLPSPRRRPLFLELPVSSFYPWSALPVVLSTKTNTLRKSSRHARITRTVASIRSGWLLTHHR